MMNTFTYQFQTLKNRFLNNPNAITKLIMINVVVFILVGMVRLGYFLFGGVSGTEELYSSSYYQFWNSLSLSAVPREVLVRPWTLLTYMFMHSGFFHIFWNMLVFYWFGTIFREFQGNNKIISTYIMGGLAGGLLYIIAYSVLPVLADKVPGLGMVGASASVLAVLVAAATLMPNYQVNLLFIGPVKLKYIAMVLVLVDLISLPDGNYGGHIAHIGGALYGFLYIRQLNQGRDLGGWVIKLLFAIENAFKSNPQAKAAKRKTKFKTYKSKDSAGVKQATHNKQEAVDRILDKIAKSGYDSLSEEEKNTLFHASNK